MFNLLVQFWDQIMAVFIGNSVYPFHFVFSKSYNGVTAQQSFTYLVTRLQYARLFSFITLIGLSVFLFYQMYKVIHALIGGVYE